VTSEAAVFKRVWGLGAAAIGRPKSVWADGHDLEFEFEFEFEFKDLKATLGRLLSKSPLKR